MKLEILHLDDKSESKLYKMALKKFEAHCPFYKIEFIKTFSPTGIKDACAFLLYSGFNEVIAMMPFYLRKINDTGDTTYFDVISTYGYGGPLFHRNTDNNIRKQFWDTVDVWYKQHNVVSEFIRFNLINNILEYTGRLIPTMNNVMGKLINTEQQWSAYDRKVRKNVKKAKRENLYVEITHQDFSKKIIDIFYDIYIETMIRTKASKEFLYPKQDLENFIEECKEICVIAITYKADVPLSAELLLLSKYYVFSFLGGTISDYFIFRPNDFLKHEVINWAYNKEYKYFVLGGGFGKNDGIFNYKKSFFPNDVSTFYTGRKIIDSQVYTTLSEEKLKNDDAGYNIEKDFFPLYRK